MIEHRLPAAGGISTNQFVDTSRAKVRMYELALNAMRRGNNDLAYGLAKSAFVSASLFSAGNLTIELERCGLTASDIANEVANLLQPEVTIAPTHMFIFGVPPALQAEARDRVVEAFGASSPAAVEFWASTEAATAFLTDVQTRAEKLAETMLTSAPKAGAFYVATGAKTNPEPSTTSMDGTVLTWIRTAPLPLDLNAIVVRGQMSVSAHAFGGIDGVRSAFTGAVRSLLAAGHIMEAHGSILQENKIAPIQQATPARRPSLGHAVLAILRDSPQGRSVTEMLDTLFAMGLLAQSGDATAMHIKVVDMLDMLEDKVMAVPSNAPPFTFKYAMRPNLGPWPVPNVLDWRRAVIGAIGFSPPYATLSQAEIAERAYDIIDLKFGEGTNKTTVASVVDGVSITIKRMLTTGDVVQVDDAFTRMPPTKCKVCDGHCPGEAFAFCLDCGMNEHLDVCADCGRRSAKHADYDEAKAKAIAFATEAFKAYPAQAMWNPNQGGAVVPWCKSCEREVLAKNGASLSARATMSCSGCDRDYIEQDDMWIARVGAAIDAPTRTRRDPTGSPRVSTFNGT
jgi:hypothetical protein